MKKLLLGAAFVAAFSLSGLSVSHAEGLRPAVGKPLTQAKAYLARGRYPQAVAAVNQAAAVGGLSADERLVIAQMRIAIAERQNAISQVASMLNSGQVPDSEQLRVIQWLVNATYAARDYPAAIGWMNRYFKAGGNAPEMRNALIKAYYAQGDFANVVKLQMAQIQQESRARQRPTEDQLDTLANAQEKVGDAAGAKSTFMYLVYYYPKPDYWLNLTHLVETKATFSDRLTLDLDRLKLALNLITTADQYMEFAELAEAAHRPAEAKTVLAKGYAANVLGVGAGADRQKRLEALVDRAYAAELPQLPAREAAARGDRDGNNLVDVGEEYVSYGQFPRGIADIQAGMAKDDLRHADDAKLHLGLAYWESGDKKDAVATLRGVGGTDGTADIAQLWVLLINR